MSLNIEKWYRISRPNLIFTSIQGVKKTANDIKGDVSPSVYAIVWSLSPEGGVVWKFLYWPVSYLQEDGAGSLPPVAFTCLGRTQVGASLWGLTWEASLYSSLPANRSKCADWEHLKWLLLPCPNPTNPTVFLPAVEALNATHPR